jgi:hypothetical protein
VCGGKCPYEKNAPESGEGTIAWDVIRAPGILKRAGMGGAAVGFDWPGALAMAGALGLDEAMAVALLQPVELRLILAINEQEIPNG